uniref:DUF4042 domain-containing protein n=1 Tax=Oryza barthii TaxID=65489 RepID=A0A0D3GWF1_9ORYZ
MDHALLIIYVGSISIKCFPKKEISDGECHAMNYRSNSSQGHEEPVYRIGVAKQPEEWKWLLVVFTGVDRRRGFTSNCPPRWSPAMASTSAAAPSHGGAREWRTALLTLRDESVASPSPPALLALLRRVLLSAAPPHSLAASAAAVSAHEVGSDVAFLAETAAAVSPCDGADDVLRGVCHLIHDIMYKTNMEIDSSCLLAMLKFLDVLMQCSLEGSCGKGLSVRKTALDTVSECLQILRFLSKDFGGSTSLPENAHLLRVLISIVSCLQSELNLTDKPNGAGFSSHTFGPINNKNPNIWDMEISAFSMIEDALSKIASSLSEDLWQSIVEVLRKVMDFLTARNFIIESSTMSRSSSPPVITPMEYKMDTKSNAGRYKPPHLRKRGGKGNDSFDGRNSDSESSRYDLSSSDSDMSDSDGYAKTGDRFRSSKARLAAILCIQDICRADPKLLTSLWPLLLPESDVLQQRKYQATLMTCLIFDPIIKVRIEAASTIASMLEGQALVLTQVAEYKESSRRGSFTTLSSSLGQILMQLHTGMLYLIQRETQTTLLSALFKVLILLISVTPYARMPKQLLPTVITDMRRRLLDRHSNKNEHYALLVNVLNCLEAAFSKEPPSSNVFEVLTQDGCAGPSHAQQESSVISILLHYIEQEIHVSVRFGALQVLRSAVHNYPSCANIIWAKVQYIVLDLLQMQSLEDQRDANFGLPKEESSIKGRCLVAAIKVIDECLRVSSGFKGTDDLKEYRLQDIQQISDCTINKTIKSAPHFETDVPGPSQNFTLDITLGTNRWIEVIERLLPQGLSHGSATVRTASLTCFAGMTYDVFFSLPENKRDYVTSSSIHAALSDTAPAVRSAACRAIGIVACFPSILSSPSLPGKFIDAIEFNTRNSSTPVRITASWALANLCSSIRFRALGTNPSAGVLDKSAISLLVEIALRLAKDGEKVKSNAVRALGYLLRFIRFNNNSDTVDDPRASSVYSILLLLLRDSNNYKIRMHAAVALAVPVSRLDYGSSFPDVVRGIEHVLESLSSNSLSSPSNFKHRGNLEKQVTFTALHLFSFVSPKDDQSLRDFLIKKASFLEDWLKSLFSLFNNVEDQPLANEAINDEDGFSPNVAQKAMLSSAVKSLLDIYTSENQHTVAQRFEQLARSLEL